MRLRPEDLPEPLRREAEDWERRGQREARWGFALAVVGLVGAALALAGLFGILLSR